MAEKEPNKLALDMIQCKKDGFGCHYGAWMAVQNRPVVIEKKNYEGWKVCPHCGKYFKPNHPNNRQIYCELNCQKAAQRERDRAKNAEAQRRYVARKKAEKELCYGN
jgi:hypothetical protein